MNELVMLQAKLPKKFFLKTYFLEGEYSVLVKYYSYVFLTRTF